jgi:hypothetical protein
MEARKVTRPMECPKDYGDFGWTKLLSRRSYRDGGCAVGRAEERERTTEVLKWSSSLKEHHPTFRLPPYHKVFYTLFALALGAKLPDFMATVPFTRLPP